MFYDGQCPMCSREVKFLISKNTAGTISFEDTTNPNFDPKAYGISSDPNRVIHAMLADGTIIRGMEVFRQVYKELGMGWIVAPTGWPIFKPICDFAYLIFAKNRKKIGKLLGRNCDSNKCE